MNKLRKSVLILLCMTQLFCGDGATTTKRPFFNDVKITGQGEAWVAVRDGKLIRIGPDGKIAYERQFNKEILTIDFPGRSEGWVIDSTGQSWFTANDGVDWEKRAKIEGYMESPSFGGLRFINERSGWLLGAFLIWGTSDGGNNWRYIEPEKNSRRPDLLLKLFSVDTGMVWLGAENGRIFRIYPDGQMRLTKTIPVKSEIRALFAFSETECLVGAQQSGNIFRTNDGGDSWNLVSLGEYSENLGVNSIYFSDANVGWITTRPVVKDPNQTTTKGILLKTVDGGKTWRIQMTPDETVLQHVQIAGNGIGWLIGEESLYQTRNGGETWEKSL